MRDRFFNVTPRDVAAYRGDGIPINPGDGVVPILQEVSKGSLLVVGTGFYVTRYGLFLTAKHVIEELAATDGRSIYPSYILHLAREKDLYLRRIRRVHLLKAADVAIGQADNFSEQFPESPLENLRAVLSTDVPPDGAPLTTYAYPENEVLDFNRSTAVRVIRGDYFQGGFLRYVTSREHSYLSIPYFETTVEVRPGASGGPVFDAKGRVIGINSRSWQFQEGDPLSYIIPMSTVLELEVDISMVPPVFWEAGQISARNVGQLMTCRTLARLGHMLFDPALP